MIDTRQIRRKLRVAANAAISVAHLRPLPGDWFVVFSIGPREAVRVHLGPGFQSRNEATAHMLLEAVKIIKYQAKRRRRVIVYTNDQPPLGRRDRIMAYASTPDSTNVVAIPDFSFWDWPDVGIHDYDAVVADMQAAGAQPPTDERLFWIGNTRTHPVRETLLQIAQDDPRILATGMTWVKQNRPERWASDGVMDTIDSAYVSLPDHCRYKYLIDVEGIGYSARFKIFLFSGRPVFLQDRPWREFYYDWLEPYRHYIPVARDLSDLTAQLDWAEANPEKCREIAAAAQAFARRHLTRDAAIAHLRETIVAFLDLPRS